MKKTSILIVLITMALLVSCEKESIEDITVQQIEEETNETEAKWFGYCNSFKGKVFFNQGLFLDFGDIYQASRTGTLILERCPNGNNSCSQVIQLHVKNGKNFTFYVFGAEFSDNDRFRVRIVPNEDGDYPTSSTRLYFGSAYSPLRHLGLSDVNANGAIYNQIAVDFPEVCQ